MKEHFDKFKSTLKKTNNKKIIMKKTLIFILLSMAAFSNAQNMEVDIKTTASFIFVKDSIGKPIPNGTCFFTAIPSKSDTLKHYLYLVTAKHVLQASDGSFLKEIYVKINTENDSARFVWAPIIQSGPQQNLYLHSDSTVDVAVLIFLPNKSDYLFTYLDTTMIPNKSTFESLHFQEGQKGVIQNVAFEAGFVPFGLDKTNDKYDDDQRRIPSLSGQPLAGVGSLRQGEGFLRI